MKPNNPSGAKPKLSTLQWAEISRRALEGESISSLAREYGIHKSGISRRVSASSLRQSEVAHALASAESAFVALPVAQQSATRALADKLRNISDHLASAAAYGAMTAHGLHRMAHQQHQKIDDADPMGAESMEALQGVAALTRIAQGSAEIGLALLKASKADVEPPPPPEKARREITFRVIE